MAICKILNPLITINLLAEQVLDSLSKQQEQERIIEANNNDLEHEIFCKHTLFSWASRRHFEKLHIINLLQSNEIMQLKLPFFCVSTKNLAVSINFLNIEDNFPTNFTFFYLYHFFQV